MGEARKILKNVFSISFAELISKGAAFIYLAIIASTLGPDNNGIITFAKSTIVIFMLFAVMGFETVGVREIAKNHNLVKQFTNSILTIRLLLSIIVFAALYFYVFHSGILVSKSIMEKSVIMVAGIQIFANALLVNFVYQGLEKMEIGAIRSVISNLLNLVGVILLVHGPGDTLIAIEIISATQIINSAWMILYYVKDFGFPKLSFDLKFWVSIFTSSFFIGLNNILITIYNNIDTAMLGVMRDNYQTGIYGPAHSVVPLAVLPALILNTTLMPQYSKNYKNEEAKKLLKNSTKYNFLLTSFVSALMFIFSDIIVKIIGKQYLESSLILKILSFNVFAMYLSINFTTPLIAWGYEKQVFWATLSGVLANVVINYMLIPHYGAAGAATATIITESLVMVFLMYYCRKQIGRAYIFSSLKYFLLSFLAVLPGALLYYSNVNIWVSFFTCIAAFILINLIFKTVSINEIKGYLKK